MVEVVGGRTNEERRSAFCTAALMYPGSYLLSRDLSSDYHRRSNVSLPGSGWDRVGPLGYDHQASGEALGFPLLGAVACVSALEVLLCFFDRLSDGLAAFCWVFACFGRVVCLGWLSGGLCRGVSFVSCSFRPACRLTYARLCWLAFGHVVGDFFFQGFGVWSFLKASTLGGLKRLFLVRGFCVSSFGC